MKGFSLIGAALMLATVQQSIAQKSSEHDTITYTYPTEIIISAPRISMPVKEAPFATSVVGSDILQGLPRAISVDEPLKLVPGVKVDNQANGERIHLSIRGQGILSERGIRGIRFLVDGIPINDPTGFAPDLFDVDFASVDRLEVLRGPAASLYGGSAAGGIVNILTQNAVDKPLYGAAQTTIGSNNFWKGFGQFGGNVDRVNNVISFSRVLGDGYREHTHFNGNNIYGKATYTPADGIQITPIIGYSHVYHENPEGLSLDQYNADPKQPNGDAIPFNEYLETERVNHGLTARFALTDAHEIDVSGFVKRTLFTEANNHTFNHRTIITPGASVEYDFTAANADKSLRNRVAVGADLQWQSIKQYEMANDHTREIDTVLLSNAEVKQRGTGIFLVDKLSIGEDWSVVGSLRYDNIHNELTDILVLDSTSKSGNADFSKATGRIGATYSWKPEANFFVNWGQGFMPPATEELMQNPDGFGGFNTHLSSATSSGIDLGARGGFNNCAYYDVTGFYLTTDNDFDRYRVPGRGVQTFYKNVGKSKRYGLELYGKYMPMTQWEIQAAYTFSSFKYAADSPTPINMDSSSAWFEKKYIKNGNFLPNSPQHQLYVDLQYRPIDAVTLGMSAEMMSKSFIDGANIESEAVKAYTLLHARIAYRWQCGPLLGELSLNARNLGNVKYVAFSEPDAGGNAYQPGAGREFFAGLKLHF
jgi:iron complex outermembrane receptor protein